MRVNFSAFILALTTLIFFIVPFFWIPPGTMDLGGDNSRLYFYDPYHFLKNFSLYSILPEGQGILLPHHYAIPYVGLLLALKFLITSPYILISLFNGIKLVGGFLSIFFIIKSFLYDVIPDERTKRWGLIAFISSYSAGILYIIATASVNIVVHWKVALLTHNQIFLNPLIFLLVLLYFRTRRYFYSLIALLLTFIFSPNFSLNSIASFFAFYPLALIFLFFYSIAIKKYKISVKEIILSIVLFFGLHSFHILPQVANFFVKESLPTLQGISSNLDRDAGLRYFIAVLELGKVSNSFLLPSSIIAIRWVAFLPLLVVLTATFFIKKKSAIYILTTIFFLITLYLASANITSVGIEMYKKFFLIPGFSMLRNFYERFFYIHIFFYALLFGQSLFLILFSLKRKYLYGLSVFVIVLLFIGGSAFLTGNFVNPEHATSNDVRTAIAIDPRYEQTLEFIRSLPVDGKILTLPLTDSYYQVVFGKNNAAYIGLSTISYLGGKNDFSGYMLFYPYPEDIMRLVREKDYDKFLQILSILNIRYIYHNTDPKIYEEKFPHSPQEYMRTSFVKDQKEYNEILAKLPFRLIYKNGPYHIYEIELSYYRAEIYIPKNVYEGSVLTTEDATYDSVYIDENTCKLSQAKGACRSTGNPDIVIANIKKVNPTEYRVLLNKKNEEKEPFILVFQNSYHPEWNLYDKKNKRIADGKHFLVNGYANGWYIEANEIPDDTEALRISYDQQRYFTTGIGISLITFIVLLFFLGISIFRRK